MNDSHARSTCAANRSPLRGLLSTVAASVALAWSASASAQVLPEVQVTTAAIPDYEFDWGRKGVNCPSCNGGNGNARFVFSDDSYRMWLGYVDYQTGAFYPADGHGVLLDTDVAKTTDFGNGPEWMSSASGSQVLYTKYLAGRAPRNGRDPNPAFAGIGLATMVNGSWSAGFFPNGMGRASPAGTLDPTDITPLINYVASDKSGTYWRSMAQPDVENVMAITDVSNGNSRRWVDGTHKVIFTGRSQVYLYDVDTNVLEQLTFDANPKTGAFMWRAPEFNNEYVFFCMAGQRKQMLVYRKLAGADGIARWTVVKTINSPTQLPYFWSPEPFVHNGHSYIFTEVSSSADFTDLGVPTQLALTGIDPLKANFRMLTNDNTKYRVRIDPEYYITAQGPFIYYNRLVPEHDGIPAANDGVWRVDTKLGPPLKQQ